MPLSYSSTNHFGFQGDQVVQASATATPIVTPNGTFPGFSAVSPVYVTSPGKGPVTLYKGKAGTPASKLTRTA